MAKMRRSVLLAMLLGPFVVLADVVPGGILVVPLPADVVMVTFEDRPLLIRNSKAIVGIGLTVVPGNQMLEISGDTPRSHVFKVVPKNYPEQRIQIANQKMVDPDPESLKRIESEAIRMEAIYRSFTSGPAPTVFNKPLNGRTSSPFGFRRVFNGEARNPHSGLDIAAPSGTPVPSPANGAIVLTGDFYFNGLSVFVDHGQGFITMVCHLSVIGVKEGQMVKTGDILGKVGATGRATGPHLHWSVSLNGYRVEPMEAVRIISAKP